MIRRTADLLGINLGSMDNYLADLAIDRKLVIREEQDEVRVYAAVYYHLELNTAKMLHDLNVTGEIDKEKILEKIQKIEKRIRQCLMRCSGKLLFRQCDAV